MTYKTPGYLSIPNNPPHFYRFITDPPFQKLECVIYVNSATKRRTVRSLNGNTSIDMWFARYLMKVRHFHEHGEVITSSDIEADHIDNDKTNDALENIQAITQAQNSYKKSAVLGRDMIIFVCPVCRTKNMRTIWESHLNKNKNNLWASTCSAYCKNILHSANLTTETHKYIQTNQILYKINIHYFDYMGYFHNYYPYSEILSIGSRKLLDKSGNCIEILEIANVWSFKTPFSEQLEIIKNYRLQNLGYVSIGRKTKTGKNFVKKFVETYLPDLIIKVVRDQYTEQVQKYFIHGITVPQISKLMNSPETTVRHAIDRLELDK